MHDFLLVFHCNYVSVLHRFWDIISYFQNFKKSCEPDHAHPGVGSHHKTTNLTRRRSESAYIYIYKSPVAVMVWADLFQHRFISCAQKSANIYIYIYPPSELLQSANFGPCFTHRSLFCTSLLQQQCSGMAILHVTPVTFLYFSHKPPLRSWTWLHHQKANETMFPTIPCPYGNSVNFSHKSRIDFLANNTSFHPLKPMGLRVHRSSTWR